MNVLNLLAKKFMGRGIDKKFPVLVWLFKKIYTHFTSCKELEVSIPLNSKLLVSSKDSGLGLMLRSNGKFEPLQSKKIINSLNQGDVVLDIGANIGYYSILASKLVGKKGKVYAFEPDPQNIKLLYKNIKLNNCSNVIVIEAALGSKKGELRLIQDLSNPGESKLSEKNMGNSVMVKVLTLDQFVNSEKIKKIDLIKVDVEGSELDVLKGSIKTLKLNKSLKLFIECNPQALKTFNQDKIALTAYLRGMDFELEQIIDEGKRKIWKYSEENLLNVLKQTGYTNIIAFKNNVFETKPKVSVLMAAYNAENYIESTIESVLNQTYKNFEFIIVNDNSTDRTLDLINKYSKKDNRIIVINLKKNLGPSLAANIGLKSVNGTYLFRVDADDVSVSTRLEKQVEFLNANPETSMLGGQCKLINSEGQFIGYKRFPQNHLSIYNSLFSRNPIQHPSCVINLKNMSKLVMLHDGKSVLAHDLELVFLASRYGQLANLNDFILYYRQYPGSFSLSNPKKTFLSTLTVRIESIFKYGHTPSIKGILTTLIQAVFITIIPSRWIYPIYSYLRGMKKIDFRNARMNLDANIFFKKAFQLVKA